MINKEQIQQEQGIILDNVGGKYSFRGDVFRKGNHWIGMRQRKDKSPIISIVPIDPSKEEEFWHEPRFIGHIDNIEDFRTIIRILGI